MPQPQPLKIPFIATPVPMPRQGLRIAPESILRGVVAYWYHSGPKNAVTGKSGRFLEGRSFFTPSPPDPGLGKPLEWP